MSLRKIKIERRCQTSLNANVPWKGGVGEVEGEGEEQEEEEGQTFLRQTYLKANAYVKYYGKIGNSASVFIFIFYDSSKRSIGKWAGSHQNGSG